MHGSRLTRRSFARVVGALVLSFGACERAPSGGPRILTGAEELVLARAGRPGALARFSVGGRISEILPTASGGVWLATWEGLVHLPPDPSGEGISDSAITESLGILDGIERDPRSGRLYLLRHPGSDPVEVSENHLVLEWDPAERRVVRTWTVDHLSYDLALDPGRGILVTPLSGRRLWWISLESGEARPIDLPPAPGRPPRRRTEESPNAASSYVRIGAIPAEGGGLVVVEQGLPDRNRVWRLDPGTGEVDGFDLSRSCHYQGGALAPDGSTLVLNAIEAVHVIDLRTSTDTAWIPLGARHFRVAVGPEGRYAYLTEWKPREEGGRITTVDLKRKRVVGRSAVPVRAEAIAVGPGWSSRAANH